MVTSEFFHEATTQQIATLMTRADTRGTDGIGAALISIINPRGLERFAAVSPNALTNISRWLTSS